MIHIAIMNPKLGLIEKILTGEKSIESRWSKYKIASFGKINPGDTVYFKYSSKPVTARATVSKVVQFERLDVDIFKHIVDDYSQQICLQNTKYDSWYQSKNYITLIFLKDPQLVKPFQIDKSGFGSGCAWITTQKLRKVL